MTNPLTGDFDAVLEVSGAKTAENFFAGEIDNFAFFNVALSQTDMDKHFNMF